MSSNLIIFTREESRFNILKHILSSDNKIIYIDLDLVITGYVRSNVIKPRAELEIHIPEDIEELEGIIADTCSKMDAHMVILDSLDTFNILYNEHLLSIYLAILLLHARSSNSKIIVTSKSSSLLLEHLFEVILSADNKIIIKHPDLIADLEFDYY